MGASRPAPEERRRSEGFALIVVLWTLVLIAFITAHVVASGRVELRIAGNLATNAVTNAAAEGAVFQAVFALMDPNPDTRWPLDGTAHAFAIGDCRVTVRVEDEAGRINPNLAPPALLEALLLVTGSDADNARRRAAAIGEWIGAGAAARTQETMLADYRAAGLDYGPPGEPLESLDELERVRGMTPEVVAALRPHLSLFAPPQPSLAHADPVVAAALAMIELPQPAARKAAPQQSDIFTARIAVTAQGPNNARATRTAIVQVIARSMNYTVLGWDRDGG